MLPKTLPRMSSHISDAEHAPSAGAMHDMWVKLEPQSTAMTVPRFVLRDGVPLGAGVKESSHGERSHSRVPGEEGGEGTLAAIHRRRH